MKANGIAAVWMACSLFATPLFSEERAPNNEATEAKAKSLATDAAELKTSVDGLRILAEKLLHRFPTSAPSPKVDASAASQPQPAAELTQLRQSARKLIRTLKMLEWQLPAESTGGSASLEAGDMVFLDFRGKSAKLVLPKPVWELHKGKGIGCSMVARVDRVDAKQNLVVKFEMPRKSNTQELLLTVTGTVPRTKVGQDKHILADDIDDLQVTTWELREQVTSRVAEGKDSTTAR